MSIPSIKAKVPSSEELFMVAETLMKSAIEVGQLQQESEHLVQGLENKKLTERCDALAKFMIHAQTLYPHLKGLENKEKELNQVKLAEIPAFAWQGKILVIALVSAYDVMFDVFNKTFNEQVQKVELRFNDTIAKLNGFRAQPTKENLHGVQVAFDRFQKRAKIICALHDSCNIDLKKYSSNQETLIRSYTSKAEQLHSLVEAQRCYSSLAIGIRSQTPLIPAEKKNIELQFENIISTQLSKEDQNSLDGEVYRLSPSPKGGPDWGKKNRYQNMKIFKEAFTNVFRASQEKKWQLNSAKSDTFYRSLHQLAFGPESADPIAWAKENYLDIVHLAPEAIKRTRLN